MENLVKSYILTNKPNIEQLNLLNEKFKVIFEGMRELNNFISEKTMELQETFTELHENFNLVINDSNLHIQRLMIPYEINNIIETTIKQRNSEIENQYKNNTDEYHFNPDEFNTNMFFVDDNNNLINYNNNIVAKYNHDDNTIYNILTNYKKIFINSEPKDDLFVDYQELNTFDIKNNTHFFFTLKNNGNIRLEKENHINNITVDLEELLYNKEEKERLEYLNNKYFFGLGEIGIFLHNKFDEITTSIIDSRMSWGICLDKEYLPLKQIKSVYDYDETNLLIITVAGKENREFYVDSENNIFYPCINKFDNILGKFDNTTCSILELYQPKVFPSTAIINIEKHTGNYKTKVIVIDNKPEFIIIDNKQVDNTINIQNIIDNLKIEQEKEFLQNLHIMKYYVSEIIINNSNKKKDLACSINLLGEMKKNKREKNILKIFRHGEIQCNCTINKKSIQDVNPIWCIHIMFIMTKIGKFEDKELYDKKILNHEEIDKIIEIIEERNVELEDKNFDDDNLTLTNFKTSHKEITKVDTCKLCFDSLAEDLDKTICCPVCHNYIHKNCAEIYISVKPECLYCKSNIWKDFNKVKNNMFIF